MAGRTMDVSVLVRLVDRITTPLGALQRRFAQFAALGQRIGILGAAAAAISFMMPIQSAARFDQALRDNVVTAGYWGDAAEQRIKSVGAGISQLALQVGIASSQLTDARGLLVAAGMDETIVDKLLPTIGRVAKAASAVPGDVAQVAFALNNTLGISAEKMEQQLARLVVAGKLGRFEFRNMAKEIPGLSAQLAKLGVTGEEAVATLGASLQVAMFGTADPAQAANNYKNFLAKLLSPDVMKNFEKQGVNILGVMQNAAAQGINPIEAAIEKTLKLTGMSVGEVQKVFQANKGKGMTDAEAMAASLQQIEKIAGAGKLSAIFGDMQVMDFLLPMLANIDKYLEFKKAIENAGLDVIAKDYATQWEGLQTQLTITEEIGTQALNRIGLGFGTNLRWINAWGIAMLQWVQQIDAAFPGLIDQVLSYGGAFLAAIAGLALAAPVLSILSAAFGTLAALIGLVLSPIGLVVAALAGIAYLIYSDWENFAPFFQGVWSGVQEAFGGAITFLQGLFTGDWSGMEAGAERMLSGAGAAGGELVGILGRVGTQLLAVADQYLGGWPSRVLGAFAPLGPGMRDAVGGAAYMVRAVFAGDWSGFEAGARRMLSGAGTAGGELVGILGRVGTQLLAAADQQLGGWPSRVLGKFEPILAGARAFGGGFTQYMRGLFSGDWSGMEAGIRQMASGAAAGLGGVVSAFGDAGRSLRSFGDDYLGGVPGQIVNIIGGVWIAVSSALTALGGQIGAALGPAADAVLNWARGVFAPIGQALGPVADAVLNWARGVPALIAGAFGETGQAAFAWLSDLGNRAIAAVTSALDQLSGMSDDEWANLGTKLGNAIADSVRAAINGLVDWFTGLPGRIIAAVGNIDIGSLIKWPALPSWLGGDSGAPAASEPPEAPASGNDNRPDWLRRGASGLGGMAPASAVNANVTGQIVVSAAPGSRVESVESSNPAVPLKKADNGRVVGRT